MNTPTPTPRPALKATGMRRRHARCPETELATLTAERDRLRAEVERLKTDYADYAFWKDAAKTRANHLESASQQMLAHEDTILQLRAEVERLKTCGIAELAAVNSSVLEYCKHWEARAELAEAESDALSKVKAHLFNALEHYQNCVIAGGKNPARDAIDAAMKEDAK